MDSFAETRFPMNAATHGFFLAAMVCAGTSLLKAEERSKPGPALTILPETRRIVAGDPLLVKVQIANPTRDSVRLDRDFWIAIGGCRIEVKGPGQSEFLHA